MNSMGPRHESGDSDLVTVSIPCFIQKLTRQSARYDGIWSPNISFSFRDPFSSKT